MSFEVDEDILQDFLVEAGEILEQLSEQLVELENNPEDKDLLNAIFRGFHTVKGGAGFLAMNELVDACHGAENVFDILRQGQRRVTAELMDVILQALDTINEMFAQIQLRAHPEPADPELLAILHQLSEPEAPGEALATPAPVVAPVVETTAVPVAESMAIEDTSIAFNDESNSAIDEISEDEFDALLDELHGVGKGPGAETSMTEEVSTDSNLSGFSGGVTEGAPEGDEDITDDEFDALLDELHGPGSFGVLGSGSATASATTSVTASADKKVAEETAAVASADDDEEISEDEFDALLDELHGKGNGPTAIPSPPAATSQAASAVSVTPSQPASDSSAAVQKPQVQPTSQPVGQPAGQPTGQVIGNANGQPVGKPAEKPVTKPVSKPAAKAAAPAAETTVRVDTKRLDQIMNMVGELVLVRNRLLTLANSSNSEDMGKAISNLDVVTADLQGAVMATRMQPIKKVFGRFPRVVRDLARSLQKDISLILEGEDTDLDKNLVEALADPLVHLVRNSVDHGIEMPAVREQAGKPRTGLVKLSASQEGDHILLSIQDDGAGMDAEKLKNIAINKGVLDADQAARLSDNEAYNLIFAPGFSTKEQISDISGRGVGMDVVKTKISQLNGTINIESQLGVGTRLDIKVPLTLAILPTLMVVVGEQTFALPLAAVNEIFHLDLTKTNVVDGQLTIIVRDKALPLFYLEHWLVKGADSSQRKAKGHVVIVQIGTQQVGFVVDSLIGQEEVVIKPLDALLQGTPGMAGATITSDGGIALILDVPSMLKHYAGRSSVN
ncbi:chemotaxis protein CheW [Pseudoalteromonas sp. T1lg75]|uniref:chemotaxis protein CheW n=1 Tax=Pseudoalteromonas sp. T1lg75 TaxID=2077102 RepID=UPI000CF6476C|nr:chemotaxis protein CheW [Pseudoalteromonas sp. T1lg75]